MSADLDEKAWRLRALWKSGRDKYASFFTVLNEVRQEVGDENLAHWTFDNLQIAISVILDTRRLLTATDAEIVKADLAAAKKAVKDERATIKRQRERIRELEAKVASLEAAATESAPRPAKKPQRDRRDYMREYMRRKRAATT